MVVKEMPVRSRVWGAEVEVVFNGIIAEHGEEVDNVVKGVEVLCRSKAWEVADPEVQNSIDCRILQLDRHSTR